MKRNWIILLAALSLLLPSLPAVAGQSTKNSVSSAKARQATVKQKVTKAVHSTSAPKKSSVIQEDIVDLDNDALQIASAKALVVNQETGAVLYAKNTEDQAPIASVTKLMTAMVVLDANLPMDEILAVTAADIDTLKGTGSRLRVGTRLPRGELLQLALMASENRAASALGRHYPGGLRAFVRDMNHKAYQLGMLSSYFVDPTGLDSNNISTAEDLAKLVAAAYEYDEIRQVSTTASHEVAINGSRNPLHFVNTNVLVRKGEWAIGLSKTGFINEAGRCLVMQAEISGQKLIIVLLNSTGKLTRIGDANRIRKWIESARYVAHLS